MSYRHYVLERLLVSVVLVIKMYILRKQCQGLRMLGGCQGVAMRLMKCFQCVALVFW